MSTQTRVFMFVAQIAGLPSVSVLFMATFNPELVESGYGLGLLYTGTACLCVASLMAGMVSWACDLFAGR